MKQNKTDPRFRRMTFLPAETAQGEKAGSVLEALADKKCEKIVKISLTVYKKHVTIYTT